MEKNKTSDNKEKRWREYIVPAILALILLNAAVYAFTHIEGASNYGDDENYLFLASSVVHGAYTEQVGYIFSVRLMSFLPIAVIYFFLGINNFSSTLWNITSYLGIIIVTFLAVKLLYDEKAALIAAFLASIFPMLTQYAVNLGEDVPLTFVTSLAVLMFLYAERLENKWYYFASGVLLVMSWLISYEAAIVILFVFVYAVAQLLRKRIKLEKTSLFFLLGIAVSFSIVFIYSYIDIGQPLATITTNLRFYSGVGGSVSGQPTIPTSTTDLNFYPNAMFQYRIVYLLFNSRDMLQGIGNIWNELVNQVNPSPYGVFFYLAIPALIAYAVFARLEKKPYFLAVWFAFVALFLEFGPMHVGISLSPFQITYLLAHRLERFMMIVAVPLCGVIGVALSKLVSFKNKYALILGGIFLAALLAVLYLNNLIISNFWYYWQYYPESITLQAADFLRPYVYDHTVYVGARYGDGGVSFAGANLPSYFGYPSDPHYVVIYPNVTCSSFMNDSYVVWAGNPNCGRLTNVLNLTVPDYIPDYIIQSESSIQMLLPTNVYHAS